MLLCIETCCTFITGLVFLEQSEVTYLDQGSNDDNE